MSLMRSASVMRLNRIRLAVFLLLCAAQTLVIAAVASPQGRAEWVLVLSWSPQYCDEHSRSAEKQCVEANYFVAQALSPERAYEGADCRPASALSAAQLNRALPLSLNSEEISRHWSLEGGCSPLSFDEFAVQLDYASRRVNLPPAYAQIEQREYTTPAEIRGQFTQANQGLSSSALSLRCAGHELSEVRICLDADMNFRDCGTALQDNCEAKVMLRGARLSRFK